MRPSIADPYLPFVREQLERYPTLPASRLFAMVAERGYPGTEPHFRRIVSRRRPKTSAEAYQRLATLPGEHAQVDWAYCGKVTVGHGSRFYVRVYTRPGVEVDRSSPGVTRHRPVTV